MTAAGPPFTCNCELLTLTSVPPELNADMVSALSSFVLGEISAKGAWDLVVVLTTDNHLKQLHADFMADDSVTDIMTFPYGVQLGGELVISFEQAVRQAPEFGHSSLEEVQFLQVHGLLHLAGWDDQKPAERTAMLSYQEELLSAFGRTHAGNQGPDSGNASR